MQLQSNNLSELATVASDGLASLNQIDTGIGLREGLDAAMRLVTLVSSAAETVESTNAAEPTAHPPLVRFSIGLITHKVPGPVLEAVAANLRQAETDLARIAADESSLSTDEIEDLSLLFARTSVVLSDYRL